MMLKTPGKKICSLLLIIVALAVMPVLAQDAVYEDPNGLFTVPIPTNWTAETQDGYGVLSDPDGKLPVYVLSVEAETAKEGLAAAWQVIDPEFDLDSFQEQNIPAGEGTDEFLQIIYDSGDPNVLVVGVAQRVGGTVYATLAKGDAVTFQQRNSQVLIIVTGLKIANVEKTDLTGVEPKAITPELLAELDVFIHEAMEKLEVPGASVAIVQGDQVVYSQGFGVKEMGADDPVTPQTRMMIGSTGKTMTTMLMAQLVDEGVLDWDTPVVDILPSFALLDPERTQQIQVRHLVCACTGVPRRDFEFIFNASELTAEDVIDSLKTFALFTDFGEAFQYSNQMVATGGYIAALAAGGEYGDLYNAYLKAMQARVFDPIGMTSTTFSFDTVTGSGDYATPHAINLDGVYYPLSLEVEKTLIPVTPAGASWSNAEDMARYLITELNEGVTPDGERVVSAENLNVTWEPQVAMSADSDYGLGWMLGNYKGLPVISHGGNTLGFTSALMFIPSADLGIVVLANGQASNIFNEGVGTRLLELVFDQESQLVETLDTLIEENEAQYAQFRERISDEIDAASITPFVGRYNSAVLGDTTITFEGGMLLADAGEFQSQLWQVVGKDAEPDSYIFYNAPLPGVSVKFRAIDGGGVEMVIGGGVVEYVFTRVES